MMFIECDDAAGLVSPLHGEYSEINAPTVLPFGQVRMYVRTCVGNEIARGGHGEL